MINASCAKATNVLLDQRLFNLDKDPFDRFQGILNEPVRDNAALRKVLETKAPWE